MQDEITIPSAQAGPTPTPTALPVRVYDSPAPPDLPLFAVPRSLQTAIAGGYLRIVKLWGGHDPAVGLGFYAQYDLPISNAFAGAQLAYLRARNPALVALYSGIGTHGEDTGPLPWVGGSAVLDPAISEPVWITPGVYPLTDSRASAVELINLFSAQWVVADVLWSWRDMQRMIQPRHRGYRDLQ